MLQYAVQSIIKDIVQYKEVQVILLKGRDQVRIDN